MLLARGLWRHFGFAGRVAAGSARYHHLDYDHLGPIRPKPLPEHVNLPSRRFGNNPTFYPDPRDVDIPRSNSICPLYAPKLGYFARLWIFPRWQNRASEKTYYNYLNKCIKFYCAKYQAGRCVPSQTGCQFHHLCEWCAGPHRGNDCEYRPEKLWARN